MAQYVYANNRDIQAIAQDYLPQIWGSDKFFDRHFPTKYKDVETLIWEQEDNWGGLLEPRTQDAGFAKIERDGRSEYIARPGFYGGQMVMGEEFLNQGRKLGTWGETIDINEQMNRDLLKGLQLAYNRERKMCWDLVSNGLYSITSTDGIKYYGDAFSFQTFTATVPWSTAATSTPLADMRSAQQLSLGHSVRFDATSELALTQAKVNDLLRNTNANDLGGRRVITSSAGVVPLNLSQVNEIFLGENLPRIVVNDEGYYPKPTYNANGTVTQGSFTKFQSDAVGVLFGNRVDGGEVINFTMTRNSNNFAPAGPGQPARGLDMNGRGAAELYTDFEILKNPIRGITTVGFNGCPVVLFPSAIVRMLNL